MTREEQKMIQLVRESDVIDLTDGSELATASRYLFDVAIKALEQEPILEKCRKKNYGVCETLMNRIINSTPLEEYCDSCPYQPTESEDD